jgi:hypothetical protein
MNKIDNLLLVAGTGRKSGKTTMVCRIIKQLSNSGIIAVKISPHFHELSAGLITISESPGYIISEETNRTTLKDTSLMLKSGAERAFFAQVSDGYMQEAFSIILKNIPQNRPVVCESPALYKFIEPGVLVLMISDNEAHHKNLQDLRFIPHAEYTLKKLSETESLPFKFNLGRWTYK